VASRAAPGPPRGWAVARSTGCRTSPGVVRRTRADQGDAVDLTGLVSDELSDNGRDGARIGPDLGGLSICTDGPQSDGTRPAISAWGSNGRFDGHPEAEGPDREAPR